MSSRSFTSAALAAIDHPNTIVVATCTNADLVDACFLHSYRLAKPIKLALPSRSDREQIFRQILIESKAEINCDVPDLMPLRSTSDNHGGEDLTSLSIKELALRTQGFTVCDILKLMREQLHCVRIRNPFTTAATISAHTSATTKLSLRTTLQAVSNTTPSAGGTTSEAQRFVRQMDSRPPTALVGMQAIQKQLLRCIGTVVPELRDADSVGGSVRKCSGKDHISFALCSAKFKAV